MARCAIRAALLSVKLTRLSRLWLASDIDVVFVKGRCRFSHAECRNHALTQRPFWCRMPAGMKRERGQESAGNNAG
jgi:hypothetical protein